MKAFVGCILLALISTAVAGEPHIGYAYPAGGQQGMTFEAVVGGQFIQDATNACFSGEGVQATVVGYHETLTSQEINKLRNRLQKLVQTRDSATADARPQMDADIEELHETFKAQGFDESGKKRLRKRDFRKQPNAQLREEATLRFTVAPDAVVGNHPFRLRTPRGLSNVINFHVGRCTEINESEPNNVTPPQFQALTLPVTLNGQIMPGDIDRFTVPATRGQRLVCTVDARSLVPYLADAVPGWCQAVLALYDAQGNELCFVDDHFGDPDPTLAYDVTASGDYTLEIRDAIYRGREDFAYRISVEERAVTERSPVGIGPVSEPGDIAEIEPNGRPATAQRIVLPGTVHGCISEPGEQDVFVFDGRAGQDVVAETVARRAGSPLDSLLTLTGPGGKVLQFNDDHVDKGHGLLTHHADAYLRCVLPKNGQYAVTLTDIQNKGGIQHRYRLRLGPPQPDFGLRVTPATLNVPAGGTVPVTVHVLRRDGFYESVSLALTDNPSGFRLTGGLVPAKQDKIQATLTVPFTATPGSVRLGLEGTAVIGNKVVRRMAVPAEDQMQAFLWRHLVTVEDWAVAVTGKRRLFLQVDTGKGDVLEIPTNGSTRVVVRATGGKPPKRPPRFELHDPPKGLVLEKVEMRPKNKEAVLILKTNSEEMKPGTQGNVIVSVVSPNTKQRKLLGTLPAIPYKVATQ